MIGVSQAMELISTHVEALGTQDVSPADALGHVVAKDICSPVDVPSFAQSAMDGWAVRAANLAGASAQTPISLSIAGELAAGLHMTLPTLQDKGAVRIFTGAPVPSMADAVVRQELARVVGDKVVFSAPVAVGRDIRQAGEHVRKGRVLVEKGQRIDERHVAILSMCGRTQITVYRQPRVTLLVSGDEVIAPDHDLEIPATGLVYDANTPFLSAWFRRRGYLNITTALLPDDPRIVVERLQDALEASDLVISTGGVSVGDYDFLGPAAEEVGLKTIFWRVAQRPGKPLLFAARPGALFLGIPGNPGAVFTTAYIYLRDILNRMQGRAYTMSFPAADEFCTAQLAASIQPSPRATSWVGCTCQTDSEGTLILRPIPGHSLASLYRAQAIAYIPPAADLLPAGSLVRCLRIQ